MTIAQQAAAANVRKIAAAQNGVKNGESISKGGSVSVWRGGEISQLMARRKHQRIGCENKHQQ